MITYFRCKLYCMIYLFHRADSAIESTVVLLCFGFTTLRLYRWSTQVVLTRGCLGKWWVKGVKAYAGVLKTFWNTVPLTEPQRGMTTVEVGGSGFAYKGLFLRSPCFLGGNMIHEMCIMNCFWENSETDTFILFTFVTDLTQLMKCHLHVGSHYCSDTGIWKKFQLCSLLYPSHYSCRQDKGVISVCLYVRVCVHTFMHGGKRLRNDWHIATENNRSL